MIYLETRETAFLDQLHFRLLNQWRVLFHAIFKLSYSNTLSNEYNKNTKETLD